MGITMQPFIGGDRLRLPAPRYYYGGALYATAMKKPENQGLDDSGRTLLHMACKAEHRRQAKLHQWNRRTHSGSYVKRSDDGKEMYLDSFDDLGARWVEEACDVDGGGIDSWYADEHGQCTVNGVVLCFTRHGPAGLCTAGNGDDSHDETNGRKPAVYMAGTYHSDWDGVTLDLDTTDDPATAARWACQMAEREADVCCEDEQKSNIEAEISDHQYEIEVARKACLALLRDMRPLRKGSGDFPESVCQALRDRVQEYVQDIATRRNQIGELS